MKTLIKIFIAGSLLLVSVTLNAVQASALVNLVTDEAGMHRITYQQLLDSGVDLSGVVHTRLKVYEGTTAIQVRTKGQDTAHGNRRFFGPGGYIEFYAESNETLYSTQRAYTLHVQTGAQNKIRSVKTNYNRTLANSTTYQQSVLVEEENYYEFIAPSTVDSWHYGLTYSYGGQTFNYDYNFTLDNVSGNASSVMAEVYGLSDLPLPGNDHSYDVLINGVSLSGGDKQFDGQISDTIEASNIAVQDGENTVTLQINSIENAPFDVIALNQVALTYERNTVAEGEYLEGKFDAQQVEVSGIPNGDATVYRRSAVGFIQRIRGTRKLLDNKIAFNTGGVEADYIVVGPNGYKVPSVAVVKDDAPIKTGDAEYLIIAHESLIGSTLDELVQLRSANYTTKVVDVAQIYGQFGGHLPSAAAIKSYINYAVANLNTKYVLIVGSDTYDYFKRESESESLVPTMYTTTQADEALIIHQTPNDSSYGDTNNDGVPDVPVGRITARTEVELGYVIEKIRDYEARQNYSGRILMAAGREDLANGLNFTNDANEIINTIPEDLWRNAVANQNRDNFRAYPDLDGDSAAKAKVTTALNNGVSVAAYIGHSSQFQWSLAQSDNGPALLSSSDAANLTNLNKPAMVTQWGCYNTYFVSPAGNSLAEVLLVGGETGAATVLGATGLTSSAGERLLGIELNKRMYNEGKTIGDAVIEAKQALAQIDSSADDILIGYQILGDPALIVNP